MHETAQQVRKVLLLGGQRAEHRELLTRVAGAAEVRTVGSFEAALEAMRQGHFDLVISEAADFLALERAAASQQAAVVLDSIGQGVCIVNPEGRVVFANPAMRGFPAEVMNQACQQCRRLFHPSHQPEAEGSPAPLARSRRFSLMVGGDQYFEVTATPVYNASQALSQVVAVVWDMSAARRLQQKIDAIDMAGRELAQFGAESTAHMNIEDRIRLLEEKILRYMHDLMHFDNFAVLLIDKKSNKLEIVLQHGMSEQSRAREIYVSPEGNGISGYVAFTGRSYICHDAQSDPRYIEGLASARSSVTVPLRLQDRIIGVFDIESEGVAAFNEDDRQFAEILGRYLAIALNTLDLLVTERHQTTGRLADDVSSEIAGPLNDILTDAATLMEEYIGHDDLRRRLSTICDNVTIIKRSIRELTSPKGGLLGRRVETPTVDPALAGKRVLVADDEDVIRETIAGVLTRHGCEVETAQDGAMAVALIGQRAYDVVLADIKMPHKNGYEVFAAATDRNGGTPVILMTGFGYDPNHSIVRARQEGLAAVLFKPFKVDQLLDALRRAVGAAGGSG